jgi:hypothetical protein
MGDGNVFNCGFLCKKAIDDIITDDLDIDYVYLCGFTMKIIVVANVRADPELCLIYRLDCEYAKKLHKRYLAVNVNREMDTSLPFLAILRANSENGYNFDEDIIGRLYQKKHNAPPASIELPSILLVSQGRLNDRRRSCHHVSAEEIDTLIHVLMETDQDANIYPRERNSVSEAFCLDKNNDLDFSITVLHSVALLRGVLKIHNQNPGEISFCFVDCAVDMPYSQTGTKIIGGVMFFGSTWEILVREAH